MFSAEFGVVGTKGCIHDPKPFINQPTKHKKLTEIQLLKIGGLFEGNINHSGTYLKVIIFTVSHSRSSSSMIVFGARVVIAHPSKNRFDSL
jgi:hypothetical protein